MLSVTVQSWMNKEESMLTNISQQTKMHADFTDQNVIFCVGIHRANDLKWPFGSNAK